MGEIGRPARTTSAHRRRRRWPRRILKFLLFMLVLAGVGVGVLYWSADWGTAFGGRVEGARLERVTASPNFVDGRAQNPVETRLGSGASLRDSWDFVVEWVRGVGERKPPSPVPVTAPDTAALDPPRERGVRFIWLGHSTVYLEIDGARVLIDPVWSQRASPFRIVGPKRSHPVPVALADLPPVDVVVISHDHYDHLDMEVVRELALQGVEFAVPIGVGAHLEAWGVAPDQLIELDWWQGGAVESLALVATPARHFSGRRIVDRDRTLWASWALVGPRSRVYYSGDTGWLEEFETIGDRYGPFDLTIIKCGAYDDGWPDIHINGVQAVEANVALRGHRMLPVHWLTFDLALHPWDEPIRQVVETGDRLDVEIVTPQVGEVVDLRGGVTTARWWEGLD